MRVKNITMAIRPGKASITQAAVGISSICFAELKTGYFLDDLLKYS